MGNRNFMILVGVVSQKAHSEPMCENKHLQLLSLKASDSNLQKWQKCPNVMNPIEQSTDELKMVHF